MKEALLQKRDRLVGMYLQAKEAERRRIIVEVFLIDNELSEAGFIKDGAEMLGGA